MMNNSFLKRFVCFCLISAFLAELTFFALPTFAQTNLSSQSYYPDSDVPLILPRSTWDNTLALNSLMTWPPQQAQSDGTPSDWQSVERIIIHDTGCDPTANLTCNNNTDPIATIQAIYRYHAVTRGWGDIGYNYIIDQQGRIYEGRVGGNGSRGAQTYNDRARDNFNFGSIGIVILGNYATWQPPEAVYASLGRLVGWLALANGLDPQGQSSSFIWNTDKKNFSTYFNGPVVLGHKDIEQGNPDPALLDFTRLRREASAFAVKFKEYLYQRDGVPAFYRIVRGTRQAYSSLTDLTNQNTTYSRIVNLPAAQLDIFSETRFLKYPDGMLVQIKSAPTVYFIEGGKKRSFSLTAKQFIGLGFDFAKVRQVTADEMLNYSDGLAIKYGTDGQLISDGSKVYLVEEGRKRWVISGNLFSVLGYKWSKVKAMALAEVTTLLDGSVVFYPDGTLFREKNKPVVYLVRDGQKHEFVSAQSFLKLGYKWDKVLTLETAEAVLCPAGSIVAYADSTLIRAENSPSVFFVENGLARPFVSAEIFLNRGFKWTQILTVSAGELVYYPMGEPVKYTEGTLLRPIDRNDVYLISGGKPVPIDGATFKKRNYKWANVLVVSARDFGILYEGKTGETSLLTPTPTATSSPSPSPSATPSPSTTPSSDNSALGQKIRVKIFEVTTPSVTLSADGAFDILNKSGQVIESKSAGENYVYTTSDSKSETFVKIIPRSQSAIVEVISYEDHPSWKPTLNYNKFRGSFEIAYSAKSAKIFGVNELFLEDYLRGVAETNQGLNMEYLKTMAVAARTYAYHYQQLGGKYGVDEAYQITNTTADQLYKGYSREAYASDIVIAQQATSGEMAIYNNQAIVTAYSSGAAELMTSGSRSACAVWGGKYCQSGYEYLAGGVKDPTGTTYGYDACGAGNHCVGLSGAGTRQMAALSKTYKEILVHYYPGITVQKMY